MEVKMREHAREFFANHKAAIRVNTEDIMVIEWRNQNGSSNYYVQYIFDAKRGMLAISGDLGDCISCWYNPLTFKNLVKYVQDIEYWMGKFQTSSDSFTYEWSNIEDNLIGIKEEYIKKIHQQM